MESLIGAKRTFPALYLGEVIWNKTKERNIWGIQQQPERPEKDWVRVSLPQFQIVSEVDWKAAHDRLSARRDVYLRGTKGELWGRPASGLDSKYLLTGLIKGGLCGGSVYVKSNARKGTRAYFYGCMTFHLQRPDSVLESSPGAMEAANEAILGVFESQVLHPEVTDTVVRKALDKFRASQKEKKHNRERYHQQIAVVDAESTRLVSAIAAGGNIPSLVQAVQKCHDRKRALLEALTELDNHQELDQTDYDELERELRAHFRTSWQTIMTRQISPTRQILGKLFNGNRIPLTPVVGLTGTYYEFKGMASIGRLLTGRAKGLVPPTGEDQSPQLKPLCRDV